MISEKIKNVILIGSSISTQKELYMITVEKEWLEFLEQKPQWDGPQRRTILLTPHPDDETLGAGGLIADLRKKNIDVSIIAITDGENSCPQNPNIRTIRQQEQEQALQLLGVSKKNIIRLKLKDSSVTLAEEELEHLLLPLIHKKDHILSPWLGDYHSDHEAVGRVALKIAQQKKAQLSFYFFWTWHYSSVKDLEKFALQTYLLSDESFYLKQNALSCYASQYAEESGRAILPPHLLIPAQRPFEVYFPYEY